MKTGNVLLTGALGITLLTAVSIPAMAGTLSIGNRVIEGPGGSTGSLEAISDAGSISLEAGEITLQPARRVRHCGLRDRINDYLPGGRYDDDATDATGTDSGVVFEDVGIFSNRKFFTRSFRIDTEGSYQAVLTDFEFPDALTMAGINITSATASLGSLTTPGEFTFDAAPGDYYLSFFGKARELGQYGIAVSLASSPVPVPAAAWLFGSGLLGLVGAVRRKTA